MRHYFKSIFAMLALLMAVPAFATGSNSLFTQGDATEISNGGQAEIRFCLNNSVELYGFQATITIPDFLEIVDCALGERTDDSYSLTVNKLSATSAKIATVSMTPLNADTDAALFTLTVKAVREGSEQGVVNVTDIIFTNAEAQDVALADFSASVVLKPTLVSSITLNHNSAELQKAETLQLEATVSPENAANKSITWSSDNKAVATVSDGGLVTAVGAGSATITATATDGSGIKATCSVTVIDDSNLPSTATNFLSMADQSVFVGKECTMAVELTNETEFCAYQFDLYLPDGVTVKQDEYGYLMELTDRNKTHSISTGERPDGAIRVLVVSMQNRNITGNSGAVLNIPLAVAETAAAGEQEVSLRNITLTTKEAVSINPPDVNAVLSIANYIPGDTNNDGVVTLSDVVNTINYVVGTPNDVFNFDAADISGDGTINVTDVVLVINLVLYAE